MSDIDIQDTLRTEIISPILAGEILQKPSEPIDFSQQEHVVNTAIVYHDEDEKIANVPSISAAPPALEAKPSPSLTEATSKHKEYEEPKALVIGKSIKKPITTEDALRIDDNESQSPNESKHSDADRHSQWSNAERKASNVSKSSRVRGAVRKLFCLGKRGKNHSEA